MRGKGLRFYRTGTFNPSGWSFCHWAASSLAEITAVKAFAGVVLGVGLSWSLIRARATGQVEVQ